MNIFKSHRADRLTVTSVSHNAGWGWADCRVLIRTLGTGSEITGDMAVSYDRDGVQVARIIGDNGANYSVTDQATLVAAYRTANA